MAPADRAARDRAVRAVHWPPYNRQARPGHSSAASCSLGAGLERIGSVCGCGMACGTCCDWRQHISAGEQAVVLLLGADKQAQILRRYCEGLLRSPTAPAAASKEVRARPMTCRISQRQLA